jgi:S1-C subfamily serine protease
VNLLDLLLFAAVASFAVSGYRRGFIVGVLSFLGFLGGGALGMLLAPPFLRQLSGIGPLSAALAIFTVLALAMTGQVLATILGGQIRQQLVWSSARLLDATAGAFTSAASILVAAWFIGSASVNADLPQLSQQVRQSNILQAVSKVMPANANTWFSSFSSLLGANDLPQVFAPFTNEAIVPVEPPDPRVTNSVAVQRARNSVVRVTGTARSCSREIEGTGFVYARQRVMTNAHVVAGVRAPKVEVAGRGELDGQVVLFDPARDLAVILVPDLPEDVRPLRFDFTGAPRSNAVVAGFPRNGPFRADAARIRNQLDARGPDIYERNVVNRQVFAVFGSVQPGNSGGPLLTPQGDVYGVIFAKSLEDDNTGYALTSTESIGDANQGARSTERVGTGPCA